MESRAAAYHHMRLINSVQSALMESKPGVLYTLVHSCVLSTAALARAVCGGWTHKTYWRSCSLLFDFCVCTLFDHILVVSTIRSYVCVRLCTCVGCHWVTPSGDPETRVSHAGSPWDLACIRPAKSLRRRAHASPDWAWPAS